MTIKQSAYWSVFSVLKTFVPYSMLYFKSGGILGNYVIYSSDGFRKILIIASEQATKIKFCLAWIENARGTLMSI